MKTKTLHFEPLERRELLAHSSPIEEAEHAAVMALVPAAEATSVAIQSGAWESAATWQDGSVPIWNDRVHIPEGLTVTVHDASADWIRVDGTLEQLDGRLTVDTLIVTATGTYRNHSQELSRMIFDANDPVDDPFRFGKGFISHGVTDIDGRNVTPWVEQVGALAIGATTVLAAADWRVGDELLVVGRQAGQDELRTIAAIDGTDATLSSGLTYSHTILASQDGSRVQRPIVANLTRSIVFKSESTEVAKRGHVMLMHSDEASVKDAAFEQLGRTDKRVTLTDPDGAGNGTSNPRGRYSLHFHRTGGTKNDVPAIAKGNVIRDGAGWGLVNHSSHVLAENNVSYNVLGSHFVGELGNEIGTFRHNLAVGGSGFGGPFAQIQNGRGNFDFGHQGVGFWLQGGGGIQLEDNISANQAMAGIAVVNETGAATGFQFQVANLPDPSIWSGSSPFMPPGDVPLRAVGNTDWGSVSKLSFRLWGLHNPHFVNARTLIADSNFWGGMHWGYSGFLEVDNVAIIGNVAAPLTSVNGITHPGINMSMIYRDLLVEGFNVGVSAPTEGDNYIYGGYFNNKTNWDISYSRLRPRNLIFDGLATFGPLTQWKYSYTLDAIGWGWIKVANGFPYWSWKRMFETPAIFPVHQQDIVKIGSEYLYVAEQADSFSLASYLSLPPEIRNNTVQSLREGSLGLWMFGRKLAADQHTEAQYKGVLSSSLPTFNAPFTMPAVWP